MTGTITKAWQAPHGLGLIITTSLGTEVRLELHRYVSMQIERLFRESLEGQGVSLEQDSLRLGPFVFALERTNLWNEPVVEWLALECA